MGCISAHKLATLWSFCSSRAKLFCFIPYYCFIPCYFCFCFCFFVFFCFFCFLFFCFFFQVYSFKFILLFHQIAAQGLNYKIKSHCTIIYLKKDTSKHVYTQQNINNIKIFKNTHIALWHYLNYNTKQQNGTQSDGLEQQHRPGQG